MGDIPKLGLRKTWVMTSFSRCAVCQCKISADHISLFLINCVIKLVLFESFHQEDHFMIPILLKFEKFDFRCAPLGKGGSQNLEMQWASFFIKCSQIFRGLTSRRVWAMILDGILNILWVAAMSAFLVNNPYICKSSVLYMIMTSLWNLRVRVVKPV